MLNAPCCSEGGGDRWEDHPRPARHDGNSGADFRVSQLRPDLGPVTLQTLRV